MSKYFSFLRKKRNPSLRDEETESFSSKMKRKDATKHLSTPSSQSSSVSSTTLQNIDESRHSIHSIDYYDELKQGSVSDPFQSDNDSLFDNVSFGEGGEDERKVASKSSSSLNDDEVEPTVFFVNDVVFETVGDARSQDAEEDEGHVLDDEDNDDLIDDFMDEALEDLESSDETYPTKEGDAGDSSSNSKGQEPRDAKSNDNLENFDLEITESIKNIEFEGSGEIMIENYERSEDVKIVDRDKVCTEQQFSGDEATNNDYRNSNLASGPGQYDVHASSLVKDNYTKDFKDDLESVDNDCHSSPSSSAVNVVVIDNANKNDSLEEECVDTAVINEGDFTTSANISNEDSVNVLSYAQEIVDDILTKCASRKEDCSPYTEGESELEISSVNKEIVIEDMSEEADGTSNDDAHFSVESSKDHPVVNSEETYQKSEESEHQSHILNEYVESPMDDRDEITVVLVQDSAVEDVSNNSYATTDNFDPSAQEYDVTDYCSRALDEIEIIQVGDRTNEPESLENTVDNKTNIHISKENVDSIEVAHKISSEEEICKVLDETDVRNRAPCLIPSQESELGNEIKDVPDILESFEVEEFSAQVDKSSIGKSSSSCASEVDEEEFDSAKEEFLSDFDENRVDDTSGLIRSINKLDPLDISEEKTSYKSIISEDESPELPLEEEKVVCDVINTDELSADNKISDSTEMNKESLFDGDNRELTKEEESDKKILSVTQISGEENSELIREGGGESPEEKHTSEGEEDSELIREGGGESPEEKHTSEGEETSELIREGGGESPEEKRTSEGEEKEINHIPLEQSSRQKDNLACTEDSTNMEDQIDEEAIAVNDGEEIFKEKDGLSCTEITEVDQELINEVDNSSQMKMYETSQTLTEDEVAFESKEASNDLVTINSENQKAILPDDMDSKIAFDKSGEFNEDPKVGSEKIDEGPIRSERKEAEKEDANESEITELDSISRPGKFSEGENAPKLKPDMNAQESDNKRTQSLTEDKFLLSAVNAGHLEAEARLAQRRAARAEARELRLRELEKQQQEQETNEEEEQYAASSSTPQGESRIANCFNRLNSPLYSKVPSRTPSVTRTRSSVPTNSSVSRRSSEDSIPDDHLPSSARELKAEFRELEERFRKAMVTNAQLDNEKATLTYEVEFLKDKISELEESHTQLTKEHKKKCSENEQLRKLSNKLKDEVKIVRRVLQERDELIQEYGLVLIGEENGEESYDDYDDAERLDDTIIDLSPRKIGVKKALLSQEASELLAKGAAKGSLDVRLRKYAEDKHELEDEVRRLKMELEEEQSRKRKENGLDYEKQKEASKSLNEYKFRVQKAEAEVSTLQANVARLESLVSRYKATAEELEKSEEELKSEKRRLQRELRDVKEKCDELESSKAYVKRQYEKLLHDRGRV